MRKWARPIWNKVWSCVRHFIKILWNNLKRLFISHGKWHHFPYCEIVFIRQICMKGFEEKSDNDGIHTSIIFEISNEFLDGELIWSPKDDKLVIHYFKIGYPHSGNEISVYRVSIFATKISMVNAGQGGALTESKQLSCSKWAGVAQNVPILGLPGVEPPTKRLGATPIDHQGKFAIC